VAKPSTSSAFSLATPTSNLPNSELLVHRFIDLADAVHRVSIELVLPLAFAAQLQADMQPTGQCWLPAMGSSWHLTRGILSCDIALHWSCFLRPPKTSLHYRPSCHHKNLSEWQISSIALLPACLTWTILPPPSSEVPHTLQLKIVYVLAVVIIAMYLMFTDRYTVPMMSKPWSVCWRRSHCATSV
jgi:hypothetical protein